ncbi:MAG: 6-phosphofructokinase [Planctomycetota bacterium]|nr:MAG: 6-phosphofructokinase [Planctomycetota bacterium]
MTKPRRIGVLTGGGDCPGLNAVIRAVTKTALSHEIEVLGIEDGYLGLIEGRARPLDDADVSNILTDGGTILGSSNTADPTHWRTGIDAAGEPLYADVTERCLGHLDDWGAEALVLIGGDGTMSLAQPFVEAGVSCVGVPKTIDNDVWGTDLTFGFLTAAATATDALDRVHTTAASHHRVIAVEVMGRNAGWLALHSGVASGSDVILLPEIPFSWQSICDAIERRRARGKRFTVICVSEGAAPLGGDQVVARRVEDSPDPIRLGGLAQQVALEVEQRLGVVARHVVLGHVQRGGPPIAADRVLATEFGARACQLLVEGRSGRMVARHGFDAVDIDLSEPANKQRKVPLEHPLIRAARQLATSFGD